MNVTRRDWLKTCSAGVGAALAPTLGGCDDGAEGPAGCAPADHPIPTNLPTYAYGGPAVTDPVFVHGVASGDPSADAVVLWTRVSPGAATPDPVFYEVALDVGFSRRVAAGTFATDASRDFTVKIDAGTLRPGVTYYYRFHCLGQTSPVGRTRTLAAAGVSRLRFAVMSCSSLAHGYFHAYEAVAEQLDLDAVIHLGDYIYEYGTDEYGRVRAYEPSTECLTLDDYRTRYRQYRRDPQLAAAHAQHPFLCVWDDHEIADDAYDTGAGNHTDATEGPYASRRAAAYQAYMEYMPIREQTSGSIARAFSFGGLCDLVMLDTRNEGRSRQLSNLSLDDDTRTMLGVAQEAFLESTLEASTARWVVLGQQVMVAPFTVDSTPAHAPSNKDAWDGYPRARERLYDAIEAHAPGRTVVLTGDIHSSWACDLSRDPWNPADYDPTTQAGTLAVEFVTPSVTSPGFMDPGDGSDFFGDLVKAACPHIRFGNFIRKGFILLDLQADKVQADYTHFTAVDEPMRPMSWAAGSFATFHGDPKVVVMDRPESPRAACEAAPRSAG